MRSEQEMINLILDFARRDGRIRAVLMNGSRVNPNVPRDIFQDYDIVYLVTCVEPFRKAGYVLPHFGEVMIMERPEDNEVPSPIGDGRYTYLVQFTDGNRVDMQFIPVDRLDHLLKDSLTVVLLDKDGRVPPLPPPSEASYLVTEPTEKEFFNCCASFSWGLGSHIPKTIWRRELPLLKKLIEITLRDPLVRMLSWSIGIRTDFACSIGKGAKNLEQLLNHDEWESFRRTYTDYHFHNIWESLYVFHDLFETAARHVADNYGWHYPQAEADRALSFLDHVQRLPPDAEAVFDTEE